MLRGENAGELEVLALWPCQTSARLEQLVHHVLGNTRTHGEWFRPSPLLQKIITAARVGKIDSMKVLRPRYVTLEEARDAILLAEARGNQARI